MIMVRYATLGLVGWASCFYAPAFGDCTLTCEDTCPDGLICREGFCRDPDVATACSSDGGPRSSCTGAPATCGPDRDDDCCSTANPIPGGIFARSYDEASDGLYADAAHVATVSAYLIDKYEVSVGRFRAFVLAGRGTRLRPPDVGMGARPAIARSGWDLAWGNFLEEDVQALEGALACDDARGTWTSQPAATDASPINCVTWYEAAAFCAWDGGYLPTEAEWNFAAAGGEEQRAYAWSTPAASTSIDCTRAIYNPNYPSGPFCSEGPSFVGTAAMGSGRWGHADLGGNVAEWVLDGHADYLEPCTDCANTSTIDTRVVRGGDWANAAIGARAATRNFTAPHNRDAKIGFRCARPLETP